VVVFGLVALLLFFVVAIIGLWIARRPIASEVLHDQFEQRGVRASYELSKVGLRTQEVRNLVIGDPKNPDLVARYALIQLRWGLTGNVSVYRIVARGVRLKGKLINNRVVWGDVSKMMPPPSNKPFALPNIVLDVADSSIGLETPFGNLGFAVAGNGNLSGGFKGNVAAVSPKIVLGKCQVTALRTYAAVRVVARRPQVEGPLVAQGFTCPSSNLLMDQPRFDLDASFSESFTNFDGAARITTRRMIAGANGLAALSGNVHFTGTPTTAFGSIDAAAQKSRLGPIYAERTHIQGRYLLGASAGTLAFLGKYDANNADLAPSMLASVTGPLAAAGSTPLGPIAAAMGKAIGGFASNFDASGGIRMVNFPGGGAARIESADVHAATGARVRVSGGDGVTYYWPASRLRIDGLIETAGGGLPTGQILLRQPRSGAPMSGEARFQPYQVGASRLALDPMRFQARANGATEFTTAATLDGPFPDGRVEAFRLPLNGRLGPNGAFSVGNACLVTSWRYFRMNEIQFGPTRLPVCPIGPAIVTKPANGALRMAGVTNNPRLQGHVGKSPLSLAASSGRIVDKQFSFLDLAARLGKPDAPVVLDAKRLQGTFAANGINGTFNGGRSTIGDIKLLVSDADGRWRFQNSNLAVNGALTLSDLTPESRFYSLRSNDFQLTMKGDNLNAGGTLVHPDSGTKITDVTIHHSLASGNGSATLDVPGLTFGEDLQPEELTRLTEGVIALVQGTLTGRGQINWTGSGTVTSTGDFSTAGMDLAAPFGPVTGLKGTIHFTDLLGLVSAPGQTAAIATINPGILVENGVIHYQLLPDQLVKVERGEWPFMGGRLILHETILNFGKPTAKRLTFEVQGLDAKTFVNSFGFAGLDATGKFDGVLPMIFDENGGRIIGGRLDSEDPGGSLAYNGEINKANLGMMGGLAFDALRDLRFRSMVIRLDGDLAGEFTTRLTIEGVALGQTTTQSIIRGFFKKLPLKLNVSIRGPFRALISMAKGFKDPTSVIAPVLPFPLDAPGLTTEVRRIEEQKTQTQTTPDEQVEVRPPPTPTER
jgi:translocation and assembly module TamB